MKIWQLLFLVDLASAKKPPTSKSDSYVQSLSVDDMSVGWDFTPQQDSMSSSNDAPPLIQYHPEVALDFVIGVESHNDTKKGFTQGETGLLFHGKPYECVKVTSLIVPSTSCLVDPASCDNAWPRGDLGSNGLPVTGLSFSLWIDLPNSFNTEEEYILDTGGGLDGSVGVSIIHVASVDGKSYSQQIYIIVSTGDKIWKAVINGLLSPYNWNNLGVRWSKDPDRINNLPLGLQVFVNKTRVFWRMSPSLDITGLQEKKWEKPVAMTIGCKLNGESPMLGRVDQPSFWMWWLQDNQIEFMDGALTFKTPVPPINFNGFNRSFVPMQFIRATKWASALENVEKWLDDTSSTEEVVCDPINGHQSWGKTPYYKRQKVEHPIDCAVTIKQLSDAMSYQLEYCGESLVRAMVRVINRAGPNGMPPKDIGFLTGKAYDAVMQKLDSEVALDELLEGKYYGNMAFLLSKLQDRDIYGEFWSKVQGNDDIKVENSTNSTSDGKGVGLTRIVMLFDHLFLLLGDKLERKDNVLIESNNTITSISKMRKSDITSGLLFPDYHLTVQTEDFEEEDPFYVFPTERAESWGAVNDFLSLHVGYFGAYYDMLEELVIMTHLHNQIGQIMPTNLDQRVSGVGIDSVTFVPNSRVISVHISPQNENSTKFLNDYPTGFMLEHKERQPEPPYKKKAMVCATWVYNDEPSKIGAWDTGGCNVTFTNDTHTICHCAHLGYFIVLAEDAGYGGPGETGYLFCGVLYGVSVLFMIVGMYLVISRRRLRHELHIIIMNQYFCLICAILCYALTQMVQPSRLQCYSLSVGMHFFFTSFALWTFFHCEKIRKTLKTHKMNGNMGTACLVSYFVPAAIVAICCFITPDSYGLNFRCFAARDSAVVWIWIGSILAINVASVVQLIFIMVNLKQRENIDFEDSKDLMMCVVGNMVIIPVHILIWGLVILLHIQVSASPILDFIYELIHSCFGIVAFVVWTVLVPSARLQLICRGSKNLGDGLNWESRRKISTRQFYEEKAKIRRMKDLQDLDDD